MANANHFFLSLCLLLLVLTSAASAATAAAPHQRLQQTLPGFGGDGTGTPPFPFVPPTAAASCWKSIVASQACVNDVFQSLAAGQLRISKACCEVLEKVGDSCVAAAFSSFPFNPTFPPLVKNVCRGGLNA